MTIISESGLYSLVLTSRKPEAKAFKRWITHDVIPSIRKHGAYATATTIDSIIADPESGIRLLQALKQEKERNKALEDKNEQDRPKVLFAEAVESSTSSILVGELAKILRQNGVDIGQNRLFAWMRSNGYLMYNKNLPTQLSMNLKLMEIKERAINEPDGSVLVTQTVKITGKGQQYFINKFLGGKQHDA